MQFVELIPMMSSCQTNFGSQFVYAIGTRPMVSADHFFVITFYFVKFPFPHVETSAVIQKVRFAYVSLFLPHIM